MCAADAFILTRLLLLNNSITFRQIEIDILEFITDSCDKMQMENIMQQGRKSSVWEQ